ncbi:uncharacterized protein LOC124157275 [Ischnura elegans]|uniref:uncharacterized protein LOC124157275 n=1 Tax=Ischnura elegans TaxID=197161 RepID=UPI001ED8A880|nr:uncharacterized protein LOC124157275 [Ischnura elegans]
MLPRSQRVFQGAILAPLVFASLIAATTTDYSTLLPKHYDFQEKSSCGSTALGLFLDRSVLLSYSTEYLTSFMGFTHFSCRHVINPLTSNTGIIAVIQAMKLRTRFDRCFDHVQLQGGPFNACGDMAFGLRRSENGTLPPPPEFISAFSGPFTVSSSDSIGKEVVSPGSGVRPPLQGLQTDVHVNSEHTSKENLQLLIAYTGFRTCENALSENMFNCGYGVCILNIFVNDGVVNCPFGDCTDEGGCENAMQTSPLMKGENNATEVTTPREDLPL